jgi:hypothetical protein
MLQDESVNINFQAYRNLNEYYKKVELTFLFVMMNAMVQVNQ